MALTQAPKRIENAIGSLVSGNIWPDACPKENSTKEWIVYTLVYDSAGEYGDDVDQSWLEIYQVHYVHKGRINYLNIKDEIRSKLRLAGFSLSQAQGFYDDDAKASHVIVTCSCIEGE